ncbi:hypothetical protein [Salinicola tamaricis]|uniref:hypothetical protein n=1 Tax=Salinicola tamaricis TaxID=1771309 RepID=UPI00101ADD6E|nr:hypothetical protein [Salinicola tamaricis]
MNPRSLPSVHTPPRWEPATLARCHDLGSDVRLFEVRPDSGATAPYTPGSHLPLQLEFDGHPQTPLLAARGGRRRRRLPLRGQASGP